MADDDQTFVVAWNPDTLEWVLDLTGHSKRQIWEVLKGNDAPTLTSAMHSAIIRKQWADGFEVYSIGVDCSITQKEFTRLVKEDFAQAKELIRRHGRQLYSNTKE